MAAVDLQPERMACLVLVGALSGTWDFHGLHWTSCGDSNQWQDVRLSISTPKWRNYDIHTRSASPVVVYTLHGRPRDTGIGVPRGLAMAPLAHPQLPMAAAQQAALRRRCWRLPLYGEEWFRLLCMRVCVVRRVMMRQVTFVVSRVRVCG
ncbi:hypothetical protein VFPFJ_00545 [Purpureocillium lilacinum]|uniref:Uncharacterized protein n=1 Tax=Purpureocillium lilacinum TaxID=33203 RepID=A0A179HVA5_PURLI|nr:hypothetical protein VFPFJ_00545 [Purpureocillium lilacinum]OAQ94436.1 hypothetical protein VFPFJ_00545 [Purpureocillium lilacinum]